MSTSLTAEQRAAALAGDKTAILSLLRQHGVPYNESREGEHMLFIHFQRALSDGRVPLSVLDTLPKAPKLNATAALDRLGYSPEQISVLGTLPRDPALVTAGVAMTVNREVFWEFIADNGRFPRLETDEATFLASLYR